MRINTHEKLKTTGSVLTLHSMQTTESNMEPDQTYFRKYGINTISIHVPGKTDAEKWTTFAKGHNAANMAKIVAPDGNTTFLIQLPTPQMAFDAYHQIKTDETMISNKVVARLVSLGNLEFDQYMQKCVGTYAQLQA